MKERGFRLSHEPSPKPLAVNRDAAACQGCELLDVRVNNFPRCSRLDLPIGQIEQCETGPLVRIPTTIAEFIRLKARVEEMYPERFTDYGN